ncbi:VirK/YbjX family protein [Solimicrobium silvestre]|uniref:VirK protein n=1 Tax=Solimicrobium silvestre TaxID=2099400 RepID=A0A2S9GZY7_9BURK|nr:DUF535 family protein [Solimicrobium silvestre]PRC93263.1 hypothetical protein S2091_2001 [Solimicrobium silvestre]
MHSGRKDASWKRAIRFMFHTMFHVKTSANWLRFLSGNSVLANSTTEATFFDRIHRPFFDKRSNTRQRTQLLLAHFDILTHILDAKQLQSVMSGSGINLASLIGKTGEVIDVNLTRFPDFDKEGGASLELTVDGKTILLLTFTLTRKYNNIALTIGGIQSREHAQTDCRTLLRDATHALHGIQPRILMIETLRSIAQQLACNTIECVNENNHIYRALRYRNKRVIHAQYNQLWLLVGGIEMTNGNFSIPSFVEEKSIESRPSKKRNEYRNRATLLHSVRTQVCEVIPPFSLINKNTNAAATVKIDAIFSNTTIEAL